MIRIECHSDSLEGGGGGGTLHGKNEKQNDSLYYGLGNGMQNIVNCRECYCK